MSDTEVLRQLGALCGLSASGRLDHFGAQRIVAADIDFFERDPPVLQEGLRVAISSKRRTMYMFSRLDEGGAHTRRHLNTFLLSRGRYLELFGYDEEFCGHYGLEDDLFRRWHRHHGTRIRMFPGGPVNLRPVDHEKGYHSLPRDRGHNAETFTRKRRLWEELGPQAAYSRTFLRTPFEVVADLRRAAPSAQPPPPSLVTRLWRRWQWRRSRP